MPRKFFYWRVCWVQEASPWLSDTECEEELFLYSGVTVNTISLFHLNTFWYLLGNAYCSLPVCPEKWAHWWCWVIIPHHSRSSFLHLLRNWLVWGMIQHFRGGRDRAVSSHLLHPSSKYEQKRLTVIGTFLISMLWPEFTVQGNKYVPITACSPK